MLRAGAAISPPPVSVANGGEGLGVGGALRSRLSPHPRPLPAMLRMGGGEKSAHA